MSSLESVGWSEFFNQFNVLKKMNWKIFTIFHVFQLPKPRFSNFDHIHEKAIDKLYKHRVNNPRKKQA